MKKLIIAVSLVLCMVGSSFAQEEITVFQPGSYRAVLEANQGRAFILVFWSLDCTHCMEELTMLGEVMARDSGLRLVLVSTDSPRDRAELQQVIQQRGVRPDSSWVFAEANSQRLRYEVDRHWFGELPRSYLFDTQHARRAVSGSLKRELVEGWLDCCQHNLTGLD